MGLAIFAYSPRVSFPNTFLKKNLDTGFLPVLIISLARLDGRYFLEKFQ
jgi:hypothetical protein